MAAVFHFRDAVAEPLFILACGAWVLVTLELCRHRGRGPLDWPAPARWSSGIWVLVPAWLALTVLQHTEPAAAMMLFLLVWAADIGAYFSGKRWGRRSLAPAISPREDAGRALRAGWFQRPSLRPGSPPGGVWTRAPRPAWWW
jgi:phosphatidate cytidylyltransferase